MTSARRPCYQWPLVYLVFAVSILADSSSLHAQITFSGATDLAVQNSPRVKVAEDEVHRAVAAVSEAKDFYVPNLSLGGGLGRSYGITLTVPTIFTVNSQSLVYSPAQRDYIRAAKSNFEAAQYALQDARQRVEEDAAATCISLEATRERIVVLSQEADYALRLVALTKQRLDMGLDSDLEWKKARRAQLQVQIQQPSVASELAALEDHLSVLTGVSTTTFLSETIPPLTSFPKSAVRDETSGPSILASEASTLAKLQQSHGDSRSRFLPQILTQSQYGRISPINNVTDYYNLRGHYNVAEFGIAIQFSLFDKVRSARERESISVAQRAKHDAEIVRDQQSEDRIRSHSTLDELTNKLELASLDCDLATEQLATTMKEVATESADVTGGRQMNPKDEMYARIDERQHYLAWIAARLELERAQLSILRQNGELESWLSKLRTNAASASANAPAP